MLTNIEYILLSNQCSGSGFGLEKSRSVMENSRSGIRDTDPGSATLLNPQHQANTVLSELVNHVTCTGTKYLVVEEQSSMVLLSACWADSVIESASSNHQKNIYFKEKLLKTECRVLPSVSGTVCGVRIPWTGHALNLDPNLSGLTRVPVRIVF